MDVDTISKIYQIRSLNKVENNKFYQLSTIWETRVTRIIITLIGILNWITRFSHLYFYIGKFINLNKCARIQVTQNTSGS